MKPKPTIYIKCSEVKDVTIELPDLDYNQPWLLVQFTDQTGLRHEINFRPSYGETLGISLVTSLGAPEIAYTPEMFSKPESPELKGPDAPQPAPQEDPLD